MVRRKIENIAAALPIFGAVIILPPIVAVFANNVRLVGVPLIVIYLFTMWLALIVGTFFLSRRLGTGQDSSVNTTGDENSGHN